MEDKYFVKRLSGSRRGIGRALGRFYAEHGLAWFRPCSDPSRISKDQIDYALPQLRLVERFDPGLAEELHGLAEGLGIPFEWAAAVVLTSGMTKPSSGPGCTAFVICSNSDDIYLARNLDFPLRDGRAHLARFTQPPDALATFGGTEALLGYTEGINERGVAIAMAMVPMEEYDWQTALPEKPPKEGLLFSIAIRIALETCESARSATEFLGSIPHLEAFNFLVADPSGDVFVVEAAPWGGEVRRGTPGEKMIITNTFSAPFAEQRAR
ncbi:C45 family autoproteolytic acyltransferase/hydrolase [Candidatus Bipolaricaulota sp. J31]